MTPVARQTAGMIDAAGNWTGKYGIRSAVQFLASPEAQERALTDYLSQTERELRANGSFHHVGQTINGRVATFTVTQAGLIAAGHRQGAGDTYKYLTTAQSYGYETRGRYLSPYDLRVETRLRTFSDAQYQWRFAEVFVVSAGHVLLHSLQSRLQCYGES
jgi:hypothetical protein